MATSQGILDLIQVSNRTPTFTDQTLLRDIHVQHVQSVVDGLDLFDLYTYSKINTQASILPPSTRIIHEQTAGSSHQHNISVLEGGDARARVCVCVGVCVAVWCSGLCSRFPVETLRVRTPPSTVSHVFLLLLYLWVVTNSQMCMSEYVWWGKKKKKKKKNELSPAKNSHWELCGARPGSSTVVVNSISFAT